MVTVEVVAMDSCREKVSLSVNQRACRSTHKDSQPVSANSCGSSSFALGVTLLLKHIHVLTFLIAPFPYRLLYFLLLHKQTFTSSVVKEVKEGNLNT